MLVNCKVCSKIFKIKPSRLKIGWGKYCSWICRNKDKDYLNKISKANSLAFKEGRKKIPKNFSFRGYHHTEEAKERMRQKLSGEGNASWVGGNFCVDCEKKITRRHIEIVSVNSNKRCWNCHRKFYKGKNHHSYLGDNHLRDYPIDFNEELKELIRKRDSYKCQLCECPQEECIRKLSIHHIDYNKENLDPKNLITLCLGCNTKVNSKREVWIKYFMEKINI